MVAPTLTTLSSEQSEHEEKPVNKRSVVFNLEKNTKLIFERCKGERQEEIWFTGDDHLNMKARSRSEAREWRRQGYGVMLNDTFEFPRADVQDYLGAFVQLPDKLNRRGLERQCSRKHGEERSDLKERARQTVFRTQAKLKKDGMKLDESSEQLSLCYINACRSARVFARRLGKADEQEMKRVINHDDPDDIQSELVERVLKENGIISPNNHRKMARRLSNYSAASVSSFDSQRQWGPRVSMGRMNSSNSSIKSGGSSVRSGGSSVSSGRSSRQNSLLGGMPRGMGDEFYAAIA